MKFYNAGWSSKSIGSWILPKCFTGTTNTTHKKSIPEFLGRFSSRRTSENESDSSSDDDYSSSDNNYCSNDDNYPDDSSSPDNDYEISIYLELYCISYLFELE